MSFLLIKSHLVQILQCIDIQCFVRKGQRKMKVLDRNFSSSRSYPVDAVTVVGKRISSFWVHGEKRNSLLLFSYKPAVITLRGFNPREWDFKDGLFALPDRWSVERIDSCCSCTFNYLGCMAKYIFYATKFYEDANSTLKVLSMHNLNTYLNFYFLKALVTNRPCFLAI